MSSSATVAPDAAGISASTHTTRWAPHRRGHGGRVTPAPENPRTASAGLAAAAATHRCGQPAAAVARPRAGRGGRRRRPRRRSSSASGVSTAGPRSGGCTSSQFTAPSSGPGGPHARLGPCCHRPGRRGPTCRSAPRCPRWRTRCRPGGAAVLVAPPGTGKTTLVPLALAGALPGRIVVAEPRRVAARAAARRMAALLGEAVGGRVGYSVRGDSRRSAATRIEVVTTGLLVRRLQADPELPGVDAVVLDECHERHLDTDLALAFCLDVRAALRPDLQLLAMSATAQAQRLAALLGGDGDPAPVVEATGALHEVDVVWAPPSTPGRPAARPPGRPAAAHARRRDRPPGAGRADRRRAGLPARRRRDRHRRRAAERGRRRRAAAARPAAGRGAGRRAPGRATPSGRPGHRAGGEQPDRAGRPRRRRRRAVPGPAGRPGPRAGLAGHRAGLAGGGHPARRPGRPGGTGRGLPLLDRRRARPAPRARRAGGRHRRPHRLRAGAGLLGRARRPRPRPSSTLLRRRRCPSPSRPCAASARWTTTAARPPGGGR